MTSVSLDPLTRWRLVLGDASDGECRTAGCTLSSDALAMDTALDWLYGRDDEDSMRNIARQGGRGGSVLSTPQWINDIHRLFPKETIERLERDAIERYAIDDVITNPDVLARAEPNETLLKAVLRTKHLMSPDILLMARKLVQQVIRQLMEKLSRDLALAFSGVLDRRRHSRLRHASSLDFRRVLKDNLRHYDPKTRKLTVEKLHFFARNQRHMKTWQVILLVDQSGSMLDSVIHAAVTAACLWGLPGIRTHLVAFDTQLVDLTSDVDDPCELLMKVQLGGGTDIQQAVGYASDIIEEPDRAIVVLISDFFEGASPVMLEQRVAALTAQKTLVLGLAALDSNAAPAYDRDMAARLVAVGAHVGAMTPGELAGWLAEKIGR
ncbi:VWA domain-containing protein [Agrobacterium vitis]|uniref:VWA domain-containing protein n=1 Tax=Agrobacterium vitis TaxID=373 RepID=UPI0008720EDA|nr:VWA domain-containing protein [Agrobacterium vitis]MCE6074071.1 VWA domain-containing protein [Agrobacterium vitis]MCM2450403.1 VWA domain-containing protein [Agrobacterium vitis]MCM2468902.1 VWA domain-containing protein [Agrobacterium vitis]MUO72299.1 VWA domain-containing protein [Agrobacterium vitis]MUO85031.1 VWA domain-containing protein [Agrobacterium vitis]